eukprot:5147913-Alexandrium_andersonii.AAC.1
MPRGQAARRQAGACSRQGSRRRRQAGKRPSRVEGRAARQTAPKAAGAKPWQKPSKALPNPM